MLRKILLLLTLIPALLPAQERLVSVFPVNSSGDFTGASVFDDGKILASAENTLFLFDGYSWKPLLRLDSEQIHALANVQNTAVFATEKFIYELSSDGQILKKSPLLEDAALSRLWQAIPLDNAIFFTGTSTAHLYSLSGSQSVFHFPGEGRLAACKAQDGSVFFSRRNGGLFRWQPDSQPIEVLSPAVFQGVLVGLHDLDGQRIAITSSGIFTWDESLRFVPLFPNADSALSGTGVIGSRLINDTLWILTYREGLLSFSIEGKKMPAPLSSADRLANPTAWAFAGNASLWWFASGVAGSTWVSNPAAIWSANSGLPRSRISRLESVNQSPIALSDSGAFSLQSDRWEAIHDTFAVSAGSYENFSWIGSQWGLFWKHGEASEWAHLEGAPVYAVLPLSSEKWLLGRPGEVLEWAPLTAAPVRKWALANFIPVELVNAGLIVIAADHTGSVVTLYPDGSSSPAQSFASGREVPLFRWNGELYLGGDADAYRWSGAEWQPSGWNHTIVRASVAPDNSLYALIRKNDLIRLYKRTPNSPFTPIPFDGESQLESATDLLFSNERIFISTLSGVIEVNPALTSEIPAGNTIVTGGATASKYAYDERSFRWHLGASRLHQGVSLDFSVSVLRDGALLESGPVSQDWSWSAPSAGSYQITFQATDPYWGPLAPVVRKFSIAKPWWLTWPALLGFALALAFFTFIVIRLSIAYYKEKNRRLQLLIDRRTAELKEANLARNRFLARVSHEIRNPLNGISNLIPALRDGPLTKQQQEAVAGLEACSRTLTSLLRDVLDLARLEAGKEKITIETVNLSQVLDDFAQTCRMAAKEKNIDFQVLRGSNLPDSIRTDGGRLRQIIQNLTGNALKFTPSQGQIRLTFDFVTLHDNTGDFLVTIEDSGPGFPQEVLEKQELFLTGTNRPGQTGSGVGLALAIDLAKRLGGNIAIENLPQGGAKATLRILVNSGSRADVPVIDRPLLERANGQRILVVEDQYWNRVAVERMLTNQGYLPLMAPTVTDASRLTLSEKIDAVLCDWDLPDGDGLSFCRGILKERPHLPVFLVTAYDNPTVELKVLAVGVHALIPKPIDEQFLLQTLANAIKAASQPGRISALASLMKEQEKDKIRAELADLRAKLEAALDKEDWPAAASLAHQSANNAALIGDMALQLHLHSLEQKIRKHH